MSLTLLRILAVSLLFCATAKAQFGPQWSGENPPRNGACFYNHSEFRGMYFCVGAGDSYAQLPSHFRKRIASIRIRGSASVELFDQQEFAGERAATQQNIANLAKFPPQAGGKATWRKRVLSLRVVYDPSRPRPARTPATSSTTRPRQGVCFFDGVNYRGKAVCIQRGESMERLTVGFENSILSVRVYGHADVVIYEGAGFSGAMEHLWSNVPDLSAREVPGDQFKTWSKRIASAEVR